MQPLGTRDEAGNSDAHDPKPNKRDMPVAAIGVRFRNRRRGSDHSLLRSSMLGVLVVAEVGDYIADPFGSGLDILVCNMGIAQGHRNLTVTKQPGHRRQRNAVQDSLRGIGVPQVMEPHILDPSPFAEGEPELH